MYLIVTKSFPPELGGMQSLMWGLSRELSKNFMIKGNAAKNASLPKLKPGTPVPILPIPLNILTRPPNLSDTGARASLNASILSFLCSFLC